jgi:hypothetical protein
MLYLLLKQLFLIFKHYHKSQKIKRMKFFTSLFFSACLVLSLAAQDTIPNPGFESWTNHGTYMDPTNWTTLNPYTGAGAVTCSQSNDAHSGSYSVKLTTKSLGSIMVPATLTTGKIDLVTQTVVGGLADTARPAYLTGWYKYAPVNTDTASLEVHFFASQAEIGTGILRVSGTVSTWTHFTVAINYSSGATPDTSRLLFVSSATDTPQVGTALWLDDLAYSNVSGIKETEVQQMRIYPNPASHVVNIDNFDMHASYLQVYSYDGQLVKTFMLHDGANELSIGTLTSGLYLLHSVSKNGYVFRSTLVVE